MNFKVSVIIPTHNRAALLERAVRSVQAQTYRPIEVIVINDGGTDNTDEVMAKFRSTPDFQVVYIKQESRERVVARNNGIDRATGEFTCFLDDDDEFMPEKFSKQVAFFQSHPEVDCLFTNCWLEKEGKTRLFRESLVSQEMAPHDKESIVRRLCKGNIIPIINIMIKTSILKKEKFREDYLTHEDYELWLRLISRHNFDFIDQPLSIYHAHESEIRYTYDEPKFDLLRVLLEYINVFPRNFDIIWGKAKRLKETLSKYYEKKGESKDLAKLRAFYSDSAKRAIAKQIEYIKTQKGAGKYLALLGLYLKDRSI